MNFASWLFIAGFLPIVIGGYLLILGERAAFWRQAWLIAASIVFYGVSGLSNLAVLAASIAANYVAGAALASPRERSALQRRVILWAVVAIDLGLLLTFKWAALLDEALDGFLSSPKILIPLAISFVTFQQIGFLVACYKRQVKEVRLFDYLFFATFFPHLIMGPILQYPHIDGQLKAGALGRASAENLAVGSAIFVFGLAKKVLFADQLAGPVSRIFELASGGTPITAPDAWFAIAAFQLQLYLDFSGYADMAIGLGRMVGINLPINFDSPLKAVDRFDLWRRWHITFVMFMRTNVFVPLVRHAHFTPIAALAVTGVLSGLWHGLGWTFVMWGLLQVAILLALHMRSTEAKTAPRSGPRLVFAIACTFVTTCLMGAMFRSPSVAAAASIYGALLGFDVQHDATGIAVVGWLAPAIWRLTWLDYARLAIAGFVAWVWPDPIRLFRRYWGAHDPRPDAAHRRRVNSQPAWIEFELNWRWALAFAALSLMCILGLGQVQRFIYAQF